MRDAYWYSIDKTGLKRSSQRVDLRMKHVWRAQTILLTADSLGTAAIMAATGKSKTCVWRWQK